MLPLFAVVAMTLLELAVAGREPFFRGRSAGGQPPDRRRVYANAGLDITEPGSSGDAADKYGGEPRQVPPTTTSVTEVTDDWIEDYDDSVCADKDPKCPAWAQAGQCMAHLEFAKANCQLSCEICTPGACTDGHVNCPLWASSGKCHLFAYTRKTCQLSCKICSIPDWMP